MGRYLEIADREASKGADDYEPTSSAYELHRKTILLHSEMTLEEFAKSARQFVVDSEVLGVRVLFAADNAEIVNPGGLVVYRAGELPLLVGCEGRQLRHLHDVKRIFGAPLREDRE